MWCSRDLGRKKRNRKGARQGKASRHLTGPSKLAVLLHELEGNVHPFGGVEGDLRAPSVPREDRHSEGPLGHSRQLEVDVRRKRHCRDLHHSARIGIGLGVVSGGSRALSGCLGRWGAGNAPIPKRWHRSHIANIRQVFG